MNIDSDNRFHELAHKALAKAAQPDELAELQEMIENNPMLESKFEQLGADSAAARELLMLMQSMENPQEGVPPVPVDRLSRRIAEVFARPHPRDEELNDLLSRLGKWAMRQTASEQNRIRALIAAVRQPSLAGMGGLARAEAPARVRSYKSNLEIAPTTGIGDGVKILRSLVTAADLIRHCEFPAPSSQGQTNPHLVVKLPGDRCVIVDIKSLGAEFLETLTLTRPTNIDKNVAGVVARLRAAVKSLKARNYPSQYINSLDYVVLFVPADWILGAALEADEDLINWALSNQVVLATPSSITLILRSFGVNWLYLAQLENSKRIAQVALELYSGMEDFVEFLNSNKTALKEIQSADAIMENRVRPAGKKLRKLLDGFSLIAPADAMQQPTESAQTHTPEDDVD